MEQRVSIIYVGVRDLAKARLFYEDNLGWTPLSNTTDDIAFYQLNGFLIALCEHDELMTRAGLGDASSSSFGGIVFSHYLRSREEVDAMLSQAESCGGTILSQAKDTPWGGYAGFFADPEGFPWEIAWNPRIELDDQGRAMIRD